MITTLAELYITDGTTRINLLQGNQSGSGISLDRAKFKRSMRNTDSIFTQVYDTVDEVYSIKIGGVSQDEIIAGLRALEGLLIQAENYFLDNIELKIVYLYSRARGESKGRYSVVYKGAIQEYADFYQAPFVSDDGPFVMDELDLGITRGAWLANLPLAPLIKTVTTYPGTAPRFNLIDNRFTEKMILSAKVFDAAPAGYTTYALGVLPYPAGAGIFPAVPAAGDIFYIGFNPENPGTVALPDAIYFNVVTPATNITGFIWEYWTGAAWVTIPNYHDFFSMLVSGVNYWSMAGMNNWATNTVDGVSANWVRIRITSVGAGPVPPVVNLIFAPKNYIEISGIGGDIPALGKLTLFNQGFASVTQIGSNTNNILMGLRCVDRGASFFPWIPPGAPDSLPVSGTRATVNNYDYINTGQLVRATPATIYENYAAYPTYGRTIDGVTSVSKDYYGTFRAYVRALYTGATTNLSFRVVVKDYLASSVTPTYIGPEITPTAVATYQIPVLYDLGQITIGVRDYISYAEIGGQYVIEIQAKCEPAGESIDLFDLVLLPIDEWSGQFTQSPMTSNGSVTTVIDSASFHRRQIRAFDYSSGNILRPFIINSSGPLVLQPGKTQRLYFVIESKNSAYVGCQYYHPHIIELRTQERFLGGRGNG